MENVTDVDPSDIIIRISDDAYAIVPAQNIPPDMWADITHIGDVPPCPNIAVYDGRNLDQDTKADIQDTYARAVGFCRIEPVPGGEPPSDRQYTLNALKYKDDSGNWKVDTYPMDFPFSDRSMDNVLQGIHMALDMGDQVWITAKPCSVASVDDTPLPSQPSPTGFG